MLYWENLVQANPFPLHSFFELFPVLKALGYPSEYGYDRGYIYPDWIHFIFYLVSVVILIPPVLYYYREYRKEGWSAQVKYAVFSAIFGLGLVALIYLGSIMNPSQYEAYNWSWAKVFRYYILITLFLQLTYFLAATRSKGALKWFAILLLGSSLCFSLLHKTYNYITNYRPFAFEHNTKVLRSNDALLNSYRLHQALIENSENYFVLMANQDEVSGNFSMMEQMVEISNGNLWLFEDSNIPQLNTSAPMEVFYLTAENGTINGFEKASSINGKFLLWKKILQPS
jgi:hypothetical protein